MNKAYLKWKLSSTFLKHFVQQIKFRCLKAVENKKYYSFGL